MKVSKEFQQLTSPATFPSIMEKNCSSGTYKEWEDKRKFITAAINDSGSILDIGCAGGFFLKSLIEWSEYDLIPHGIDIVPEYIAAAQDLFPKQKNHFAILNLKDISQLSQIGLPTTYTFIYWSTSDKQDLSQPYVIAMIKILLTMATNRLILGFYGSNKYPFDSQEYKEERKRIEKQIEVFKGLGFQKTGSLFNPTKFNNAVVWIDR